MAKGKYPESTQELHPKFELGSLTHLQPREITTYGGKHLRMLNIEPTNACNLKCSFCTNSMQSQYHIMSLELYTKIIDGLKGEPQLVMMNFHKDGEPTLNPNLPDMIAIANARNLAQTYHMNTNGVSMDYEYSKRLLKAGLNDITFSVDAFDPDTYRELKGAYVLLDVERNIHAFLQARKDTGMHCGVRVKIMEHPDMPTAEIDDFIKYWSPFVNQVQVTGCHNWGESVDIVETEQPLFRHPCNLLWYMLAVNADGTVSTCNFDWSRCNIIGDARYETLPQIFNGQKMEMIRLDHVRHGFLTGSCQKCSSWSGGKDMGRWYGNHC